MVPEPQPSTNRAARADLIAVLALVALWMLYFWRIFTPSANDALSLTEGDFSGQFVAFFGYQVERLSGGEIPLWNPYNYAGHPFLADTQSAVFYPPRLLTVALVGANPLPGALYTALQTEMALHVLLGSLLMYAFVRRITADHGATVSAFGGMVAALTLSYGGYTSGYPQLQLAVLEAGIWLPLALLGIFQATRHDRPGWLCIVLAGVALALSLLAGHPQTSLFALYLALAYLAYRLWQHAPRDWRAWARRFVPAAALLGLVAGGLTAVQLLPGLEYLQHTSRQAMSFDAKGNGFPFMDVAQVLFPGFLTHWSPLYFGIAGLALAGVAAWRGAPGNRFFGAAALVGLVWSFGAGTVVWDLAYLLAPGASWFRGQERAAFVIAHSASVLAGLGTVALLTWGAAPGEESVFRRALLALAGVCAVFAAAWFVLWQTPDGAHYDAALRSAAFATLLAVLTAVLLPRIARQPHSRLPGVALVAVIAFDLFSVTMGTPNYDPIPAGDRLPEPAIARDLREDMLAPGARIDGQRGITDNYGTLYAVPDVRGISPLTVQSVHTFLEALPPARAWDLLAVRFVLTDWEELPVPSEIVAEEEDAAGPYNVHQLADPRPFAWLTYGATVVASDDEAYGLLREPAYDARQHAILDRDPGVTLPGSTPQDAGRAEVRRFEPETIAIEVETPTASVLTLSLPQVPGWRATIDGQEADILRAYGGLSAVALPEAGAYTVTLRYRPWTFTAGAILSAASLIAVAAATVLITARSRRARRAEG